jgi:hypothetical protein
LKWQRGKSPAAKQAAAEHMQARHRDGAVRLVQYEQTGRRLRSVVVSRGEEREPEDASDLRWGQLNSDNRYSQPDSRYEEQVRAPFGESPADDDFADDLFAPLDDTPEDELPTPPADDVLPPYDDEELALPAPADQPADKEPTLEQPPRTFQQPTLRQPLRREPPPVEPLPPGTNTLEPDDFGAYDSPLGPTTEIHCAEELAKLKARRIQDVNLSIAVTGTEDVDYPRECPIDDGSPHPGRAWAETVYTWKASALCHKPLYFEDEALERYGHSWGPCLDPLVSGAHFFTKLPALPYCMGLSPPCECQYALGHYRPGSCAPYMCDPVPIMSRASLLQAGAVVGAAALLP